MESRTKFTETANAANLLEQFHSLSRRPGKKYARSANAAAATFFGKDFLTIADFLAPIGEVLIEPAGRERDNSVQNFITSSLHRARKPIARTGRLFSGKNETMAEFLIRLGS